MAPQNSGKVDKPALKKRHVEQKFQAVPNSPSNPVEFADDDLTFTKRGTEPFPFN